MESQNDRLIVYIEQCSASSILNSSINLFLTRSGSHFCKIGHNLSSSRSCRLLAVLPFVMDGVGVEEQVVRHATRCHCGGQWDCCLHVFKSNVEPGWEKGTDNGLAFDYLKRVGLFHIFRTTVWLRFNFRSCNWGGLSCIDTGLKSRNLVYIHFST